MKKKVVSMILVVCVIFSNIVKINADEQHYKRKISLCISENVPQDATTYIYDNFKGILQIAELYCSEYNCTEKELEKAYIGEPYIIYEMDNIEQNMIYHYPVIYEKDVLIVIDAIKVEESWNLSASIENVELLNKIKYAENQTDYIFYEADDLIYAESKNEVICGGKSVNESDYKRCKLYKERGQGNYGMCWAASCATIINYLRGTAYKSKGICKSQDKKLNEGASIQEKQETLEDYGVKYSKLRNKQIKWSKVKENINSKYPIAVSSASSVGGHAVTVYGYREIMSYRYVIMWNSGLNGGKGGTQIVTYDSDGTTFSYANETFTWTKTLSKK